MEMKNNVADQTKLHVTDYTYGPVVSLQERLQEKDQENRELKQELLLMQKVQNH